MAPKITLTLLFGEAAMAYAFLDGMVEDGMLGF
jgi:hypothetical protein